MKNVSVACGRPSNVPRPLIAMTSWLRHGLPPGWPCLSASVGMKIRLSESCQVSCVEFQEVIGGQERYCSFQEAMKGVGF